MKRSVFFLTVVLLAESAGLARADEARAADETAFVLARGVPVRLRWSNGNLLVGRVVSAAGDDLAVLPEGALEPVVVPKASIRGLEVAEKRRNTLRGLAGGALLGLLAGLAVPVDPSNCGPQAPNVCSRGEGIAAGLIGGSVIGVAIGAATRSDHWRPVNLSSAEPAAPHPAVKLALRF